MAAWTSLSACLRHCTHESQCQLPLLHWLGFPQFHLELQDQALPSQLSREGWWRGLVPVLKDPKCLPNSWRLTPWDTSSRWQYSGHLLKLIKMTQNSHISKRKPCLPSLQKEKKVGRMISIWLLLLSREIWWAKRLLIINVGLTHWVYWYYFTN